MGFIEEINGKLNEAMKTAIALKQEGKNTYRLLTPFVFEDGDGFVAFIETTNGRIRFTDYGNTLMHVSYDVDINSETRKKILDSVLATHDLTYNEGEIVAESNIEEVGLVFWDFIQGLIRISDISLWKFERASSLFFEEFEEFMESRIKPKVPALLKNWHEPAIDESSLYEIPWLCRNGGKPLFVFPIQSTVQCDQAVKSCLKYEGGGYKFNSFAVYAEIEKINTKSINQLMDLGAQSVSSFDSQRKDRAEKIILDRFVNPPLLHRGADK